jgi:hypothetical protein
MFTKFWGENMKETLGYLSLSGSKKKKLYGLSPRANYTDRRLSAK